MVAAAAVEKCLVRQACLVSPGDSQHGLDGKTGGSLTESSCLRGARLQRRTLWDRLCLLVAVTSGCARRQWLWSRNWVLYQLQSTRKPWSAQRRCEKNHHYRSTHSSVAGGPSWGLGERPTWSPLGNSCWSARCGYIPGKDLLPALGPSSAHAHLAKRSFSLPWEKSDRAGNSLALFEKTRYNVTFKIWFLHFDFLINVSISPASLSFSLSLPPPFLCVHRSSAGSSGGQSCWILWSMERQSSARATSILNHTGSFLQLDSYISLNTVYNGSKILNGCKNTWFHFWWSQVKFGVIVTKTSVSYRFSCKRDVTQDKLVKTSHKNDFMSNAVQGNI